MNSLRGISSFVDVANTGSFTAASKLQGVSSVAIGKSLATLERQMGVRLIQRTTRRLSLTPEGELFLKEVLGPLRDLESAKTNVQTSSRSLSGLVRITAVPPIARRYLLPSLAKFQILHPKVQIEMHFDDTVADMVNQGYDLGIRVGKLPDSNLVARPIAQLPFVICASPSYLAQHGKPSSLTDLYENNCIRLRRAGQKSPMPWFISGAPEAFEQRVTGNLFLNDFGAILTVAELGQGICCLPLPLALESFRSGQLRPLLLDSVNSKLTVYLHFPNRKNLPARTRALIDFLIDSLKKEPELQLNADQLLAPFVL
jgi:DNA-binding transcriptional LysR family regulator